MSAPEEQRADRAAVEGPVSGLTVEELRGMLERQERVTILDVRPEAERREWSIPGSIHRDAYNALRADDPSALSDLEVPTDQPVVTVCATGRTSQIAAVQLRRRGIDAFSLVGGMKSWSLAWNTAELAARRATLIQVRRTGKG
jgi:rhodanese-related sulfurtransferase